MLCFAECLVWLLLCALLLADYDLRGCARRVSVYDIDVVTVVRPQTETMW